MLIAGGTYRDGSGCSEPIYVAMNMHWGGLTFELPEPPGEGRRWHVFANTALAPPEDARPPGTEPPLPGRHLLVGPRSVVILVGR
jgi:glycogen operon protein